MPGAQGGAHKERVPHFPVPAGNTGKIVSRDELIARLWESDAFVDENTLTVNVARLRKKLAQIVQKRFDYVLGEKNTRAAKANDSYYLLLHVKEPIIIVECGFLSNPEDEALLLSENYQRRIAETICEGTLAFLAAASSAEPAMI